MMLVGQNPVRSEYRFMLAYLLLKSERSPLKDRFSTEKG